MQVAPKTLRALSPSAITRIGQMADWLWNDHEEHAALTRDGLLLPTATGTSEHNALLAFVAALPAPAIAELFALAYVGADDRDADRVMEVFQAVRDLHLGAQMTNVQTEAEKLLAHMPLGQNLRRGLRRLAMANLTAQTIH